MTSNTTKLIRSGILGASVFALTACGATTGNLAKVSMKEAAIQTAVSQVNQPAEEVASKAAIETQVATKPGDADMTCEDIKVEMASLDASILEHQAVIEKTEGMKDELATASAKEAVKRSGLFKKVPFGGALSKSAFDAKENSDASKAEAAQAAISEAQLRQTSLTGLHTGKGCE